MSAPERALVRRAGRKQHFASRAAGAAEWLPACDVREIPAFGAEVEGLESWSTWLRAAQADVARLVAGERPVLCSRCRSQLLVAGLAVREHPVEQLEVAQEQIRSLRAEVSKLTTDLLAETKRAGAFLRDHVVFPRAVR